LICPSARRQPPAPLIELRTARRGANRGRQRQLEARAARTGQEALTPRSLQVCGCGVACAMAGRQPLHTRRTQGRAHALESRRVGMQQVQPADEQREPTAVELGHARWHALDAGMGASGHDHGPRRRA
jgi:hypothetical protein